MACSSLPPLRGWQVLGAGLVLLIAACGDGDDSAPTREVGDTRTTHGADEPAGEVDEDRLAAPSGEERSVEVGQTVWNFGFGIEVLSATLGPVTEGIGGDFRPLVVRVQLTNRGPDDTSLRGTVLAVFDDGSGGPLPAARTQTVWDLDADLGVEVPSGGSGEGELRFGVSPDFDLDRAFLVFGDQEENEAIVPLGAGGPELVSLEPLVVEVAGEILMERFDLAIREVQISADNPHSYRSAPRGERRLYLYFDFTHRRDRDSSLGPPSFELVRPDGTGLEPASWGPSFTWLPPTLNEGLWLRFPLPDEDVAGEYTLHFSPSRSFQGANEPDTHTLTFTVP